MALGNRFGPRLARSRGIRQVTSNQGESTIQADANATEAPATQAAPILSADEVRSVVFIIRCARAISFLQRVVPGKYLPPPEDQVPPSLLRRLIHELKKLIPKHKWTPAARSIPRSAAKLGEEFFYALTALRTSRLELRRAGYAECADALDETYSLLFEIGSRARARKDRSRQQTDTKSP